MKFFKPEDFSGDSSCNQSISESGPNIYSEWEKINKVKPTPNILNYIDEIEILQTTYVALVAPSKPDLIQKVASFIPNLFCDYAARMANLKLEREGKVVYSVASKNPIMNSWFGTAEQPQSCTYKALLINIEPTEKCSHPKDKVKYQPLLAPNLMGPFYRKAKWICECGAVVQPREFEVV